MDCSENTKNILNFVYDLRNEFDFNNIEDYQLLLFLIFNNYKYNQENSLLGHETDHVVKKVVNQYNQELKLSDKYLLQYYNEINNNFNINNILDYQKLLFIYITNSSQSYQKNDIMANICKIIYDIEKIRFN